MYNILRDLTYLFSNIWKFARLIIKNALFCVNGVYCRMRLG